MLPVLCVEQKTKSANVTGCGRIFSAKAARIGHFALKLYFSINPFES